MNLDYIHKLFLIDGSYILSYNYIIGIFLGFSILQVSQAILPMILTVRKYFKERQTTTPQGNEQSQEVIPVNVNKYFFCNFLIIIISMIYTNIFCERTNAEWMHGQLTARTFPLHVA